MRDRNVTYLFVWENRRRYTVARLHRYMGYELERSRRGSLGFGWCRQWGVWISRIFQSATGYVLTVPTFKHHSSVLRKRSLRSDRRNPIHERRWGTRGPETYLQNKWHDQSKETCTQRLLTPARKIAQKICGQAYREHGHHRHANEHEPAFEDLRAVSGGGSKDSAAIAPYPSGRQIVRALATISD